VTARRGLRIQRTRVGILKGSAGATETARVLCAGKLGARHPVVGNWRQPAR